MAPRSGTSCHVSWEDLLSRGGAASGGENGGLFTANNASSNLPGTSPPSALKGPASNLRQSNGASGSWILPDLNVAFSPQFWEHQAQRKHSEQRAKGSLSLLHGKECYRHVFCWMT